MELSKYTAYSMAAGHPAVASGSSGIWQSRAYVLSWERNTTTMPIMVMSQRIK